MYKKEDEIFSFISVPAGAELNRIHIDTSQIVFMLSGKTRTVCNNSVAKKIKAGTIFLLPKFAPVHGTALEPCEFFICRIPDGFESTDKAYIRKLPSYIPPGFSYEFNTLTVVPVVRTYLRLLMWMLKQGFKSATYQRLKRIELFYYLKTCYSPADMAAFMYPLIGGRSVFFKDFVISNYRKFQDVESFACAASMSVSTFSRKFKESFGMTAYKWLNERRAEEIYRDIVRTEDSFTEIADKYGFSSSAYFVYYCRRHFGRKPSEIRTGGVDSI